jgi:glutathione peroxidase
MNSLYDYEVTAIDGTMQRLDAYRGQVLLIVNVASQCVFTRQYDALEDLYRRHKDQGFSILGFPCNQFGNQEPGDEAAIKQFCSLTYSVSFPLFKKIDVNGPATHPLYQFLKSAKRGAFCTRSIKWNFTKFLINRGGQVIRRFGPAASVGRVERALGPLLGSVATP